jgi:hypothetical protein
MPAMIVLMLLLTTPQDVFADYRAATRAEVPCDRAQAKGEVTVCGRREADKRYRVPLTSIPVRDQVHREREALLADKMPKCGRQLMLTDCGMVGVTMTHGGGSGTSLKPRKLVD